MPTLGQFADQRDLKVVIAKLEALHESLDATPLLQEAVDLGVSCVILPQGTFRTDGSLTIPANVTVLGYGAELLRPAAATSTAPIVHLKGTKAKLIGGTVKTEKAHPNGIIAIGHLDLTSAWNAQYIVVRDVEIRGIQAAGNVAVKLSSSQPELGPNFSSYWHKLDGVTIRGCDIGVWCTEKANSNLFLDCHFWDCITTPFRFEGCYDNHVLAGFLHTSTDGVVGIQLLNRGESTYKTHHADNNTVKAFSIEPGGANSIGVYIDSNCIGNDIEIMNNVPKKSVILNKNNRYMPRFGEIHNASGQAIYHEGEYTAPGYVRKQGGGICVEGATVKIAKIPLASRNSARVTLEMQCSHPGLDGTTSLRRQFRLKRVGTTTTVTEVAGQSDTDGNFLSLAWSNPTTGTFELAFTAFQNGTNGTYKYSWKLEVQSSEQLVIEW